MKYFFTENSRALIILIIIFSTIKVNAQWQQTNGPTGGDIYCMSQDGNLLYVSTNYGIHRFNENTGIWTSAHPNFNMGYIPHFAVSGQNMFIPYDVFECNSQDSGNTWLITSPYIYNVTDVLYKNSVILLASESPGPSEGINLSFDNGITFTNTGYPYQVYSLTELGDTIVACAHMNGRSMAYSTNNFVTWDTLYYNTSNPTYSVTKIDNWIIIGTNHGILRSNDGGNSWNLLNYIPANTPIRELVSSGNTVFAACDSGMYRSYDYGATWESCNSGLNNMIITNLVKGANCVFVSTYGGVFKTIDNGDSWISCNTGLNIPSIRCFANASDTILAGTKSGLYSSDDNGINWQELPVYGEIIKIQITNQGYYVLTNYKLYHSTDLGQTWVCISDSFPDTYVASFFVNGTDIYAGTYSQTWKSNDYGLTWSLFNIFITSFNNWDYPITGNDSSFFIGSYNKGIYISLDGGISWSQSNNGLPFTTGTSDTTYSSVTNISYFGDTLLAIVGSDLYWSSDTGNFWHKSIINPLIPVIGISDLYMTNDKLFISTNKGIYVSGNGGQNWLAMNDGMPSSNDMLPPGYNVPVCPSNCIGGNDNYLFAAPWTGNNAGGAWKYELSSINLYNVTGKVFKDDNNDGILNLGEQLIPGVITGTASGNSFSISDNNGLYSVLSSTSNDTLLINNVFPYSTVNPIFYLINQSDTGKNFGIHFTPNINDLQVTITNLTPARPGFIDALRLTYKNNGTTIMNGSVKLIFDQNLSFISSNPVQSNVYSDSLIWNFTNLDMFETRNIDISFQVASYTIIGSNLDFTTIINPIIGDTTVSNNLDSLHQMVTGSFDPNLKEVCSDIISPTEILNDKELTYTIHFQNTGNDTAFTVRILDTLSSNLDILSLEFLSSSNPYTFHIYEHGILEIIFDQVLLPDSTTNQVLSNGFIKYVIKPKSTLQCGDEIYNTAHIYFDFNSPVATNTTQTEVQWPLGISSINNNITSIAMYPNPSTNKINISWSLNEKPIISILNLSGQLLYQKQSENEKTITIDMSGFTKGLYLVKVVGKDFVESRKLVIQ